MLASVTVFFRHALSTGLSRLYGDGYDAVIEAAILEHWRGVLTAGVPWNTTLWFWPHPGTLGFNDTLVIPALASVPARLVGADPFLAAFTSHVALRAAGFLGMYVLLRRGFATRFALALAGATVFTTANVSLLQMYHPQTLSVGLLPWLGFLLLRTLCAAARPAPAAVAGWGTALALLYGATALSTFYAAWFFALFALLLAAWLCLVTPVVRRAALPAIRASGPSLVLVGVIAMVALVPLLLLYLPKLDAGATRGWGWGPAVYLPDLQAVFNVGADNLLWGWMARRWPDGEAEVGIPPILLTTSLFALSWSVRERARAWPVLAIAAASITLLALTFRWPGDLPVWRTVWQIVPGADAIRTVSRALLFAIVPLVLVTFLWLDRVARPAWLTVGLIALLLVEQIQLSAPLHLNRHAAMQMLQGVGAPPRDCTAFFVVAARGGDWEAEARAIDRAWGGDGIAQPNVWRYPHNVDAMLIASYHDRPTVNGFSSFNPPDWSFADARAADYIPRVRRYAARHGLRGLCGLDTRRHPRWFRLAPATAAPTG